MVDAVGHETSTIIEQHQQQHHHHHQIIYRLSQFLEGRWAFLYGCALWMRSCSMNAPTAIKPKRRHPAPSHRLRVRHYLKEPFSVFCQSHPYHSSITRPFLKRAIQGTLLVDEHILPPEHVDQQLGHQILHYCV
jgi:hypothetical protein